jgi:predicted N-acetyltransferase YhbS
MAEPWIIERLDKRHDRRGFRSGNRSLDVFLATHAGQYDRRRIATTYVAARPPEAKVFGFYAASSGEIGLSVLPESVRKKLPQHPVPAIHLGRLAVDVSAHGQGLGKLLLFDCLHRACRSEFAVHALDVVAADENAKSFYGHFGFLPLEDHPNHLYLPIKTIEHMLD